MQVMFSAPRFGKNPFPLRGYEKREMTGIVRTFQKGPLDLRTAHFQQVDTGLNFIAKVLLPQLQKKVQAMQTLATTPSKTPLAEPALRQAYLTLKAAEREIKLVLRGHPELEAAFEVMKDTLPLS